MLTASFQPLDFDYCCRLHTLGWVRPSLWTEQPMQWHRAAILVCVCGINISPLPATHSQAATGIGVWHGHNSHATLFFLPPSTLLLPTIPLSPWCCFFLTAAQTAPPASHCSLGLGAPSTAWGGCLIQRAPVATLGFGKVAARGLWMRHPPHTMPVAPAPASGMWQVAVLGQQLGRGGGDLCEEWEGEGGGRETK